MTLTMSNVPQSLPRTREVKFLQQPAESLRCVNCRLVLVNPVQTTCGCRMCRTCAEQRLMQKGDPTDCPNGLEDCRKISISQEEFLIRPDNAAQKELGRLKVFCLNRESGCLDNITWRHLEEHLTSCHFALVACPACFTSVLRKNFDLHKSNDCPQRTVACTCCGNLMTAATLLREHTNLLNSACCYKFQAPCMYCNSGLFDRETIQQHKETCAEWRLPCPFAYVGCQTMVNVKEMDEHSKNSMSHHLRLSVERLQEVQSQLSELEKNQVILKNLVNLSVELASAAHCGASVPAERVRTWDSNAMDGSETVDNVMRKLASGKWIMSPGPITTATTGIMKDFATFNSTVAKEPNDVIFRCGQYIWRIDNYFAKKDEAKRGIQPSINSPPFYTSEFGYKMCLRVYLFGDGVGQAKYVSVFFVIMRGQYDDILSWPFRQRVTLMILDQSGDGQHLADTFKPDASSACYKKPDQVMNVASGCPQFAKHDVLETSEKGLSNRYVRSGTLYVKIIVEQLGLPKP